MVSDFLYAFAAWCFQKDNYVVTLVFLPYLTFIFFGECLNPLTKPMSPAIRIRWRFAKSMALSMVLSMVIANALIYVSVLAPIIAFALGGIVFLLLGFFIHKRRNAFIESLG